MLLHKQVPNIQEIDTSGIVTSNPNDPYFVARSVLVVNTSFSTKPGGSIDTSSIEYKIIRDFTTAACKILPVSSNNTYLPYMKMHACNVLYRLEPRLQG